MDQQEIPCPPKLSSETLKDKAPTDTVTTTKVESQGITAPQKVGLPPAAETNTVASPLEEPAERDDWKKRLACFCRCVFRLFYCICQCAKCLAECCVLCNAN